MKPALAAVHAAPPSETGEARSRIAGLLLVAIIATAVLSPGLRLSGSLPDIRVEQILAVPALAWVAVNRRRRAGNAGKNSHEGAGAGSNPNQDANSPAASQRGNGRSQKHPTSRLSRTMSRLSSTGMIDAAFATLGLLTLLSTLAAPPLLHEPFSPRDLYEPVKLLLYWVLFRFAQEAATDAGVRRAGVTTALIAGGIAATVGLAQYLGAAGAGQRLAGIWAPEHHLRALLRDGRAPGTVGNPNYYGALMAMLGVTAFAFRSRLTNAPPARSVAIAMPLVLAPLGVVLSGSRGALVMLVAGIGVATVILAVMDRMYPSSAGPWWRGASFPRALLPGIGGVLAALVLSVLFVEAVPRGRQSYTARVAGGFSPGGDSSLALRLERWRSALGLPAGYAASTVPGPPVAPSGRPGAGAEARAHDARVRSEVDRLVGDVRRFRQEQGALPSSLSEITPRPVEDVSPYRLQPAGTGFVVSASLLDPSDPDFPVYARGDGGTYLADGDVEYGDAFRTLPGTAVERSHEAALYGSWGLVFRGNPAEPTRRAAMFQQRSFNRPPGGTMSAAAWVKIPRPVQGQVELYANVYYTDGARADPVARVAADSSATGVWQRLNLTIAPDPARRVDFIGVYILSDAFSGEAWIDGLQLVDGPLPRSFTGLAEAPADASGAGANGFRRSPLIGAGPGKAAGDAVLDNEYLLVLSRYGLLGLAGYLGLWAATGVVVLRAARAGSKGAAAVAGIVAGLLLFNLVAGSLYHLQLMGVFWPLAGVLVRSPARLPELRDVAGAGAANEPAGRTTRHQRTPDC